MLLVVIDIEQFLDLEFFQALRASVRVLDQVQLDVQLELLAGIEGFRAGLAGQLCGRVLPVLLQMRLHAGLRLEITKTQRTHVRFARLLQASFFSGGDATLGLLLQMGQQQRLLGEHETAGVAREVTLLLLLHNHQSVHVVRGVDVLSEIICKRKILTINY